MSIKLNIETKTFVNGTEVNKMSVEALVELISTIEGEIKKLSALDSKPKKVAARIAELQSGLADLVKIADAD